MRKIEGTVKFEVYMYRGKQVRRSKVRSPESFVYKQSGRVMLKDENDKTIKGKALINYGDLIDFINRTMREKVQKDLKEGGRWRKS